MRKNSRLDQDSNPGLQLYALALKPLSHPDDPLGQRILAWPSGSSGWLSDYSASA